MSVRRGQDGISVLGRTGHKVFTRFLFSQEQNCEG